MKKTIAIALSTFVLSLAVALIWLEHKRVKLHEEIERKRYIIDSLRTKEAELYELRRQEYDKMLDEALKRIPKDSRFSDDQYLESPLKIAE